MACLQIKRYLFRQCRQGVDLQQLSLGPADKAILRFFNFAAWLEAKALGQSFASVVQRMSSAPLN